MTRASMGCPADRRRTPDGVRDVGTDPGPGAPAGNAQRHVSRAVHSAASAAPPASHAAPVAALDQRLPAGRIDCGGLGVGHPRRVSRSSAASASSPTTGRRAAARSASWAGARRSRRPARSSPGAAGYEHFGEPVLPAMELIATVARRAPGASHTYSAPVPLAQVRSYLDVAHEHHMLLILDLQPGRASFASQAKALAPVLVDPSVGLALDPEWQVGPGGRPGNGSIGAQLGGRDQRHDGLVVAAGAGTSPAGQARGGPRVHVLDAARPAAHQPAPRRRDGAARRRLRGPEPRRSTSCTQLRFPSPPFGVGFKLFLTQDSRLMSPREVMQLRPRPDVDHLSVSGGRTPAAATSAPASRRAATACVTMSRASAPGCVVSSWPKTVP